MYSCSSDVRNGYHETELKPLLILEVRFSSEVTGVLNLKFLRVTCWSKIANSDSKYIWGLQILHVPVPNLKDLSQYEDDFIQE